ncbi:hypothetical protein NS258_12035 [Sphingomonas sanguinis]|uniref:Uncharacterized protein n=2 Tax=Sphingomonas sanguinis TaxID=33051 RepID=A0A147J797_9SPHN|nr:hypothetical protein NS258_12035 [Sphingomonas sanguinis]
MRFPFTPQNISLRIYQVEAMTIGEDHHSPFDGGRFPLGKRANAGLFAHCLTDPTLFGGVRRSGLSR